MADLHYNVTRSLNRQHHRFAAPVGVRYDAMIFVREKL
jgi:hypothetical protein